jgi:hypothetical protein
MLQEKEGLSQTKKIRQPLFQMLLLDNGADENVRVQEADQVDFSILKAHLQNGGSVFITSKPQEKIIIPKAGKAQQNYNRSRRTMGALLQATYKQLKCDVHP